MNRNDHGSEWPRTEISSDRKPSIIVASKDQASGKEATETKSAEKKGSIYVLCFIEGVRSAGRHNTKSRAIYVCMYESVVRSAPAE